MINAGANYQDKEVKEVVVDENLITSRTPKDLPAFCREILQLVSEKTPDHTSAVGADK